MCRPLYNHWKYEVFMAWLPPEQFIIGYPCSKRCKYSDLYIFTLKVHVPPFFQLLLELKNVSSSSRQLRITPPSTKYFSVGLGKSTNQTHQEVRHKCISLVTVAVVCVAVVSLHRRHAKVVGIGHSLCTFLVAPCAQIFHQCTSRTFTDWANDCHTRLRPGSNVAFLLCRIQFN